MNGCDERRVPLINGCVGQGATPSISTVLNWLKDNQERRGVEVTRFSFRDLD
jgi:hypothetical protein